MPDKITVRFTTESKDWITTIAKNDFAVYYTGQYKDGETVKVLYNPDRPTECVIVTKKSETTSKRVAIIIGIALIGAGVYFLFKPL